MAQTEFDRQAEVTRLLLEGISSTHVSPVATSSIIHFVAPHVPTAIIQNKAERPWISEARGEGRA